MNRLLLSAQVVERKPLRYTPAGLPALDLVLRHESQVSEDGHPRQVSLEIRAVGIGDVVDGLKALTLGETARFAGFLTTGLNGRGLRFHVTSLDAAEP